MKMKNNGSEMDWISTKSRQYYNWGRGIGKYIKNGMNRRVRQQGKKEIQDERP
jgi:hypothetical protein